MNSWQDCDYNRLFFYKKKNNNCIPCKKEGNNVHLWMNYPFNLLLQIPLFRFGSFSSVDGEMRGCCDIFFVLILDGHTLLIVFIWMHLICYPSKMGQGDIWSYRVKEQCVGSLFLSFFYLEFSFLSCCSHLSCELTLELSFINVLLCFAVFV